MHLRKEKIKVRLCKRGKRASKSIRPKGSFRRNVRGARVQRRVL